MRGCNHLGTGWMSRVMLLRSLGRRSWRPALCRSCSGGLQTTINCSHSGKSSDGDIRQGPAWFFGFWLGFFFFFFFPPSVVNRELKHFLWWKCRDGPSLSLALNGGSHCSSWLHNTSTVQPHGGLLPPLLPALDTIAGVMLL